MSNIKRKYSFKKFLILFSYIFLTALVIFTLFITFLAYNSNFRQFIISKLTEVVNNQLLAKVEVKDIHLIGFGGIKLDEVKLITQEDTLANINSVFVDLSLKSLLKNQIIANKVILNEPQINLLRRKSDSSWNYDRIAEPSKDTSTSHSKLFIKVKKLDLRNSRFSYIDSLETIDINQKFNSNALRFDNFNLIAYIEIDLAKYKFKTKINKFSSNEITSGINIKQFQGNFLIDTSTINAENVILNTNYFKSNFQVFIQNIDIFHNDIDLDKVQINLDLFLTDYNFDFTQKFLDIPEKIIGNFDLQLNANGNFEQLEISELNVLTKDIELYLNGYLYNIIQNFTYELTIQNSKIDKKSLASILPLLKNSIPNFNIISIAKLDISGSENYFNSVLNLFIDSGEILGKIKLEFIKDLIYSMDITAKNLDFSSVIPNFDISGKLNSKISINGKGTTFENLNLKANIEAKNSQINNIDIAEFKIDGEIKSCDFIKINDLFIQFENDSSGNKYFALNGLANIQNIKNPSYSLQGKFNNINLKKVLKNHNLPNNLTGKFQINGENFKINELNTLFSLDLEKIENNHRAIIPAKVDLKLNFQQEKKFAKINSNFLDLELQGNFTPSILFTNIANQLEVIANQLEKDISRSFKFYKTVDTAENKLNPIILDSDNSFFDMNLNFKDLSFLNVILLDYNFSGSIYSKLNYVSNTNNFYFSIDTLKIQNFNLFTNNFNISSNELISNLVYNVNLDTNKTPYLSYIDLELISQKDLNINKNNFSQTDIKIYYSNETIHYDIKSNYNNKINLMSKGLMDFSTNFVKLLTDTLLINYNNYSWINNKLIELTISDNFINIDNFEILRIGNERLVLSGTIIDNLANGLNLNILSLDLKEISYFIDKMPINIDGKIDFLDITLESDLNNPEITLNTKVSEINIDNNYFGEFYSELNSRNGLFTGFAYINNKSKKLLEILINRLPIYIGLDSNKKIIDENEYFEANVFASELSLQLIDKFIPNISQLQGSTDLKAKIFGYLPKNINYSGNLEIKNGFFNLDNTNISYRADGRISFSNKLINIEKFMIRNLNRDLRDGKAEINGYVRINDNSLDYIDIKVTADKLLVLSDATKKVLPEVYGTLVIGTENGYIRFFGNLREPNLEGDINIINGDLKMPQMQSKQIVKSNFTYEIKQDKRIYKLTTIIDTSQTKVIQKEEEINFADLINYDLRIKMKNFSLLFDMGTIGEVYAKIGTKDPSIPLRYTKLRTEITPKLYNAELEVKEGSTVKIFRSMETKGFISFPTGSIENPSLDLQAKYEGSFTNKNITNYFTVYVYITGTAAEPKIKLEYTLNGNAPIGDPKKIEEDAFILLATGRPRGVQSNNNAISSGSLFDESLNMGISQLASKSLSDLLLTTGVVQSADVKFEGEGMETAKVNFSGTLFGVGNWTIGGNIYDLTNLEISFEVPISVNSKAFNDIIFQISRSTNSNINSQLQEQKDFEMKIKLGGSW